MYYIDHIPFQLKFDDNMADYYDIFVPKTSIMFKILALIGVIYFVYRFQDMKKISSEQEEDNGEEFIDYEEVD